MCAPLLRTEDWCAEADKEDDDSDIVGEAALTERTGPMGTSGSKARGSMVRTADPTKLKVRISAYVFGICGIDAPNTMDWPA